jgi:hypothetical protein
VLPVYTYKQLLDNLACEESDLTEEVFYTKSRLNVMRNLVSDGKDRSKLFENTKEYLKHEDVVNNVAFSFNDC